MNQNNSHPPPHPLAEASDRATSFHSCEEGCLEGEEDDFGLALVADDPFLGRSIRGVRIEHVVAEGGMGRVYRGIQIDLDVPVAIKIIRPEIFSPLALDRFKFEMRLLARLEHVGIPRIKFADVLDGQPYFVMEFVPAARGIVSYAVENRFDLRQKLELFRRACEAVGYGHMSGVIHRDLKPGNILVDMNGQPKVIDFGIALFNAATTSVPGGHDRAIGSAAYMSPEQWQCNGSGSPDVRSDVYSLGVVLYELLTGERPYPALRVDKPANHRATFRQAACEQEPTSPCFFAPTLAQDIERIVLRCLKKDPEQRYSNARELAEDIGRFLADEPVLANPPGPWRLARYFARRHRTATVSTTLVVIAMGAAIAGIGYQQGRLAEARVLAQAEELDQLLLNIDSLRRIYRTIVQRLEELIPEDHLRAATRLRRVADFQSAIGAWKDTAETLRVVRSRLQLAAAGQEPIPVEMEHEVFRDLVRAELLSDGTPSAFDPAMEFAESVASKPAHDPQRLDAEGMLAVAYRRAGRPEEARRIGEKIVPLLEAVWGRDHRETLMAENNLAVSCRHVGEHRLAHERLRDVYLRAGKSLGSKDPDTLQYGHNLAVTAIVLGRVTEAESLLAEIWQCRRAKFGASHPLSIQTLTELCQLLRKRDDAAAIVKLINDLDPSLQEIGTGPDGMVHRWCKRILKTGYWAYGRVGDEEKAGQLLIAIQAGYEPPPIPYGAP